MTHPHLEGLIRLIGEMIEDMREQEPHCTECAEKLLSRYANELVGIKAALAALPGGGVDGARSAFARLTDDQRMEVMLDYCRHCGCTDPRCQCWNDE